MTQKNLISTVASINKLVSEFGDNKFNQGLTALDIDPRYYEALSDKAIETHEDIIDGLFDLIHNVIDYLPTEERGAIL